MKNTSKLKELLADKNASLIALQWIFDQRVRLSRALANNKPVFLKGVPSGKSQQIGDEILKALQDHSRNPETHLQILMQAIQTMAERYQKPSTE